MAALALLIAAGAVAMWSDHVSSRAARLEAQARHLDIVASLAAHEVRSAGPGAGTPAEILGGLNRLLQVSGGSPAGALYLADPQGSIVAREPPEQLRAASVGGLFRDVAQPVPGRPDVIVATLRDGTAALAAIRSLPSGYLLMVQPLSALPVPPAFLQGSPTVALLFVLGIGGLAGGCICFARRARVAGTTCTRLTRRLDASLIQGRCGVFDWDVARGQVVWSASMYDLLGYEPRGEDLTADEVAAIIRPVDQCLVTLVRAAAAAPQRRIDHEMRARTATGHWMWLRITGEVVRDPVDGGQHIVGFAADVTEERRRAASRADADLRLRDAVETLSEAFALYDAEDRLILCNSKFRDLHDLPAEITRPGTSRAEITAAMQPCVTANAVAGQHRDLPGTRRMQTQLPDGRWLQVNERRMRDGGIVSVETDVSALKRSEAKLRERERQLKGSVRQAETAAQHFAALAERKIEENQAKTEFLARMSHELRTPLNAIIGFAEVMRDQMFGPIGCERYAEYSRDIHQSGMKLLDVIDGILQMSRIESGRIRFNPELTRVEGVIEGALAGLRTDLAAKDVSVLTDVATPLLLQADRSALHDVLVQLLRNAIRFTAPGGAIRICARQVDAHVHVYVEDAGIGIEPEIIPRLGKPFVQAEAEYRRSGGGTGLGLAIARGLAEMHGGRMRIRSEPGVGTIVLVRLPLVQPAANDHQAAQAGESQRARPVLIAAE
ncbi:PAS domain-containing sensor histidine kinase [Enterovirga sp.]|uniref:sensor histidine kinase n=1 Tax=Enterovirga sp. TaxID=2026350 RepID=UPI002609ABF1|nr:PAS domain-containing sensor histidine kinase [Enterovirga sp.]